MRRPPRPAPIVAAAVLLLVVGSEFFLFACVSLGRLFWPQVFDLFAINTSPESGVVWGLCLATLFFRPGLRLLTGNVRSAKNVATLVDVFAYLGLILVGCSTLVFLVFFIFGGQSGVDETAVIGAALVAGWANVIGLWKAGALLRRHADRYHEWRTASKGPTDELEDL